MNIENANLSFMERLKTDDVLKRNLAIGAVVIVTLIVGLYYTGAFSKGYEKIKNAFGSGTPEKVGFFRGLTKTFQDNLGNIKGTIALCILAVMVMYSTYRGAQWTFSLFGVNEKNGDADNKGGAKNGKGGADNKGGAAPEKR